MTEVDNPPLFSARPPKAFDHVLDHLGDGGVGSVQHARIGIALDHNLAVANDLDSLGRVVEPVKTDNIVPHVAHGIQGVPLPLGEDNHGNRL